MTLTQKQDNGWNRVLCNVLDDMRQRKAFCDTIILADDGHMFTAHACILAAASPVLKTHLMSRDIHIQIDGIAKRTWEVLLQFIYCGDIMVLDAEEVEQVLRAGMLLNLTGQAELCKNLFLAETTNQTCDAVSEDMSRCQEETNTQYDTQLGHGAGGSHVNEKSDVKERSHVDENSYVDDDTLPMESTHGITEKDSFTTDGVPCETETAAFVGGSNHVQSECHEFQCKQEPLDIEYVTETTTEEMQMNMLHNSNTYTKHLQCSLCEQVFASIDLLANHRHHSHQQELPYTCQICGKMCRHLSALGVHMRTHTREQPFKCPICGRAFSDSSNLGRHKRLHTGERPYKCLVCGKTFTQVSHLRTHTRIHTREKPYACRHCGKTYTRKSAGFECPCRPWFSCEQTLNLNECDVMRTVSMSSGLAT